MRNYTTKHQEDISIKQSTMKEELVGKIDKQIDKQGSYIDGAIK